ncbi:MAG: ABC transporter ATP-binding protein, partial [Chloroflexota bacterium]
QIAGYDVVENSLEVRKRVGYMPETVPLYPEMTVFDYLKFMSDLRRVPDAEDRIDELLDTLHLGDRADSIIGNLSKGMRQRVGLAQAMVHRPDVLILDEPTIGLDPAQIIEVRNLIREVGRQHTIMLSTHILSEAQQVCNRVLIINRGRIVAEDTPEMLQARLTGAKRVVMQVSGDTDGLEGMLAQVSGVMHVRTLELGKLEFETSPGYDPRPDVARLVVNAGLGLMEMRPVGLSLEEIFLQLTRDEPAPLETAGDDLLDEIDAEGVDVP